MPVIIDTPLNTNYSNRIYANDGNPPLLNMLEGSVCSVLDVGCGDGTNAALIKQRFPEARVDGITISSAEVECAAHYFDNLWLFDLECLIHETPKFLSDRQGYDAIVCSHVLEHLRQPAEILDRISKLLRIGGQIVIAVPNTLRLKQRLDFLFGKFEYQASGVLDATHLRFFTYLTADRYLLGACPDLELARKSATGNIPLWLLRRHVLPREWSAAIDRFGYTRWPNLFGDQVLLKALRTR